MTTQKVNLPLEIIATPNGNERNGETIFHSPTLRHPASSFITEFPQLYFWASFVTLLTDTFQRARFFFNHLLSSKKQFFLENQNFSKLIPREKQNVYEFSKLEEQVCFVRLGSPFSLSARSISLHSRIRQQHTLVIE